MHIHSLRRTIEADPANPQFIQTIRGVGYKLRSDGRAEEARPLTRRASSSWMRAVGATFSVA